MRKYFSRAQFFVAILVAKSLILILRFLGSGATTLPGKIAKYIHPGIIPLLTKDLRIIMVTGTNGKTTTSRIVARLLEENTTPFITNKSGANLISGLISTLIDSVSLGGKHEADTALFEIDEAAFKKISSFISPDILIVTNFFRDQLDRYGELYTTLKGVREGIILSPSTRLVLNADDSLCASLGVDVPNEVIYYGLNESAISKKAVTQSLDAAFCLYCQNKYDFNYRTFSHLGSFYCEKCGYSKPEAMVAVNKIFSLTNSYSEVEIETPIGSYTAKINLPGLYNIYNALAAATFAELLGYSASKIISALKSFECGFGRQEVITINDKNIKLILVKNPTGFNQVLEYLLTVNNPAIISFIINDNLADGTDISWLWDVDFEMLSDLQSQVKRFYTSGTRAEDMSVRLKYSGIFKDRIFIEKDYKTLIDNSLSDLSPGETLYLLPTYTSMLEIRSVLKKMFKLKDFWK